MINAIDSLYGVENKTDGKSDKLADEMGKDAFLNLLVVQLKNQDPLNPSDPTEFTAQLAQYSSLEQLHNINDNMKSLDLLAGEFGRLSALSLIDKNVVVNTREFEFAGHQTNMGFNFQDPVESVTIYIRNQSGQSVHQIAVQNPTPGENMVPWDGKNGNGQELPPGQYTFSVIGETIDGKEIQGMPLVESRVTGVDFSGVGETLLTSNGKIALSDITRVNNSTQ